MGHRSAGKHLRPRRARLAVTAALTVAAALAAGTVPADATPRVVNAAAARRPVPATAARQPAALMQQDVAAGAPGVVVRVNDGRGRTISLARQAAWTRRDHKLSADDRFRMGSNTKTMIGVLVLQLVTEHRLSLQDPVEKWLPGLVPGGRDITLKMLLNHTSGLFDYIYDPGVLAHETGADKSAITPAELLAVSAQYPPLFALGTAEDGTEAVEVCGRLKPDVVMLDIRMPRRDGLWALAELGRRGLLGPGRTQALMLTTFDLDRYVDEALAAGATGFLLKNSSYEELTAAVRATAAGHNALSPTVTHRIIQSHLAGRSQPDNGDLARLSELTPRERDVLRLVGDGLSNAEIADQLVVSLHTVKTHVSRMLAKTGCQSRAQAAVLARRTLS